MDPFLDLYCINCSNLFMYCDCVHSFVEPLPEDATSHESDNGDDDDDDDEEEGVINGTNVPVVSPEKPPRPSSYNPSTPAKRPEQGTVTPSPPKKPKPNEEPGVIIVDKPKPSPDDSSFVPPPKEHEVTDEFDEKGIKPAEKPIIMSHQQIEDAYWNRKKTIPAPFINSQKIETLINKGMPIYTGPYEPQSEEWTTFLNDVLEPWVNDLPNTDKYLYNSMCIIIDGGPDYEGGYYEVRYTIKEDPVDHKKTYIYDIMDLETLETFTLQPDTWIPPYIFSDKEKFKEFFFDPRTKENNPYYASFAGWVPNYKIIRTRSGRRDPFYQKDNQRDITTVEVNNKDEVFPPVLTPVDVPHTNPKRFYNTQNNTETLHGQGFRSFSTLGPYPWCPIFTAGNVSTSVYATEIKNSDFIGNPGYETGRIPNPYGLIPFCSAYDNYVKYENDVLNRFSFLKYIRWEEESFLYTVNKNNTTGSFVIPCDLVNRKTNEVCEYIVQIRLRTSIARSSFTFNVWHEEFDGSNKYYPAILENIQLSQKRYLQTSVFYIETPLKIVKDEGKSFYQTFKNIPAGGTIYINCLIKLNSDDPRFDHSLGKNNTLVVSVQNGEYEIVNLKTIMQDNRKWGFFKYKPEFPMDANLLGSVFRTFPSSYDLKGIPPSVLRNKNLSLTSFQAFDNFEGETEGFANWNVTRKITCGQRRNRKVPSQMVEQFCLWPMLYYDRFLISDGYKLTVNTRPDGDGSLNGAWQGIVYYLTNTPWRGLVEGSKPPPL